MKTATVYRVSARYDRYRYESGLQGKFEKALKKIDLGRYIAAEEVVPLKMHLGNRGAFRTVRPQFVRMIADAVKRIPAKPFVTDSARPGAWDYLEIANEGGYNHLSLGAPVVIADGIYGKDTVSVRAGKLLKKVAVPTAIADAPSMVVVTHVKGHIQAVLGGAIKNIAMGGVSATPRHGDWHEGRGRMHFLLHDTMKWNRSKCVFCMDCKQVCPVEAISFPKKTYTVDAEKCWRCGRCSRVCPTGAIGVPSSHETFMESLAEAAGAVLSTFKKRKVLYVSFLIEMQPECDCMPTCDVPVAQDQGILISDDIVAIDTATLDILSTVAPLPGSRAENLSMEKGWDIFSLLHKKDGRRQVAHAERLGLGTTRYRLEDLG